MANDNKHDLSSDGISFDFFNMLWMKDELNFGPSVNLPDTVVYKFGQPVHWYFTATNGRIKQKNRHNLMNARIEEAFTKQLLGYDIIATFIAVVPDSNDPNEENERKPGPMTIEFLNRAGLNDFLYNRKKGNHGILQRFIEPKGVKNETIRAIWSPKVCLLERAENIHQLHDHRYGLYERCITFEGPDYYSVSTPLRGPVLAGQLQKVCEAIVSHVSEVTFAQQQISRVVLNFKVDSRDKLWLLYSTSIRCANAASSQNPGDITHTSAKARTLVNIDNVITLPEQVISSST